jgi:hypothetical protein
VLVAAVLLAAAGGARAAVAVADPTLTVGEGDEGSTVATVSVATPGDVDVQAVTLRVASTPAGATAAWVSITPPASEPVSPPVDVPFTVSVAVPDGTAPGRYAFVLSALADGRDQGQTTFTVAVTGPLGCTDPTITVKSARFGPGWGGGRYRGALTLRGVACVRATLSASVGGPSRSAPVTVAPGRFTAVIRGIGGGLRPGRHTVAVAAKAGGGIQRSRLTATLPPPPQGLVSRAYVSGAANGPPVLALPGRRTQIWARYVLSALPRPGLTLRTLWYQPDGSLAGPPVPKPRTASVEALVTDGGGLTPGTWRSELRAGSTVLRTIRVRVGG